MKEIHALHTLVSHPEFFIKSFITVTYYFSFYCKDNELQLLYLLYRCTFDKYAVEDEHFLLKCSLVFHLLSAKSNTSLHITFALII